MQENYMDKLAQERGIFNKLREKANITGRILESLNPEFHDMMEKLRLADEKIREHAVNAKELVRSAKSLVRRRDYLAAAVNLSAFHERARYIGAELERFIKGVNLKHYQFLLDQFDDEQKEQLFGYDPTAELKMDEASVDDVPDMVAEAALTKQAGLSDWWFKITDPIADLAHNVTTQRGIAMRALEKRFSIAFLKQLKAASGVMVTRADQFLSFLLRTFKKLATALAKRNVDQYATAAKEYINRFTRFHAQFVDYYQKNVVPLKERYSEIQEEGRKAEEQKSRAIEEEAERKREEARPRPPGPRMQPGVPSVPYQRLYEPSTPPVGAPDIGPPGMKPAPSVSEELKRRKWPAPSFQFTKQEPKPMFEGEEELPYEEEKPFNLYRRRSLDFFDKLEKHAIADNPQALVMEILRHSAELENISPEQSLRLLAIAEGIIEDYKTAGIFDWFKKDEDEPTQQKPQAPLA
jgi:hypothetical protein